MQSLLRLMLGLALWPAVALADSTVNVLPDAASPLSDGSCLYVDQGPGTDTKLCTQWGAALGISTAGASTVIANPGAITAPASPVALPNCPDTGGNHLNWTAGTPGSFSCGKSGQPMTILQVTPTNPAANASGASQMTGMGTSIVYYAAGDRQDARDIRIQYEQRHFERRRELQPALRHRHGACERRSSHRHADRRSRQ